MSETVKTGDLFHPFQKWGDDGGIYGLCADYQGNVIEPWEGQDYIEYRLCADGDDRWQLEVSEAEETREVVYRGRIPNRAFFVELMSSIEASVVIQGPSTRATDAENQRLREALEDARLKLKHIKLMASDLGPTMVTDSQRFESIRNSATAALATLNPERGVE